VDLQPARVLVSLAVVRHTSVDVTGARKEHWQLVVAVVGAAITETRFAVGAEPCQDTTARGVMHLEQTEPCRPRGES
jgi:hypothetical protein